MSEEKKRLAQQLREAHDLLCRVLIPVADSFVVSQVRQTIAAVITELEKEEPKVEVTEAQ